MGPAPVEESVIRRLVLIGVLLAFLLFACRIQQSEDGADGSVAVQPAGTESDPGAVAPVNLGP